MVISFGEEYFEQDKSIPSPEEQQFQLIKYKQFNDSILSKLLSTIVKHLNLYKAEYSILIGYMCASLKLTLAT